MTRRWPAIRTTAAAVAAFAAAVSGVVVTSAVPAGAASGCTSSGEVCIRTFDSGTYVGDVEVKFIHVDDVYGHAHVYGEGWEVDTPDEHLAGGFCAQGKCRPTTQVFTFHPRRGFRDGSLLCAEIWQRYDDGSYNLRGRPCLTIHA